MTVLLAVLSTVIFGYWYVTDSARVRASAEEYLSRITGARVKVGSANLSIFEGLRLDNVQMFVGGPSRGDSRLFSAQSFRLRVDLAQLVRGKIEAASILAIGPSVLLAEDVDTGEWNYERLRSRPVGEGRPSNSGKLPELPEIRLRNARVEYGRTEAGQFTRTGSMTIEAQLIPDDASKAYQFRVQSRGESELLGPRVVGSYNLANRRVEARLDNFEFDRDMRAMLPEQVQQWWRDHALAGRVDVPQLSYTLGEEGAFAARVSLNRVTLVVQPHEAQSADEIWRRTELAGMFGLLSATGANSGNWLARASWLIEPQPVTLHDAQGVFAFTNAGIELRDVIGRIEGNAVKINGHVTGYSPDAPLDLKISSLEGEQIVLPQEIRWINSLPPVVRETYDHLRPRGAAELSIELNRATRGDRVDVQGAINIRDGGFTFDKFPYPIDRATGRIIFGPDAKLGVDALELVNLQGYGVRGGPNENSVVRIDGLIAPLKGDAGVDIRISGKGIATEPMLMQSFPPVTRRALSSLDAPGKGEYPTFTGDFVCSVLRPPGPRQPWSTDVDIDVRDGQGAVVAFPYFMSGIRGQVKVRKDHVEIVQATMERDGARLVIDGKVEWGDIDGVPRRAGEPTIRPKLTITARNAPIDDNLLNALPETHRTWLQRLGLSGRFDLAGVVETRSSRSGESLGTGFEFLVTLNDATLWPKDGTFAVTRINGDIDLKPESMTLRNLTGRRNDADMSARGTVAWPNNQPSIDLSGEATNLELDSPLYQILPRAGQVGWEMVAPLGTVDARVAFKGNMADGSRPTYAITLKPRKLAVRPNVFPAKFSEVTGDVSITPEAVVLSDLIARRGESRISLAGAGDLASGVWDLKLSADRVSIDPELVAAMPATVGELVKSAEMAGVYDVLFRKLRYIAPKEPSQAENATSQTAEGKESVAAGDLEFDLRLETADGSLMAGVPVTQLAGWFDMAGESRGGRMGALEGRVNADSFLLGGREMRQFTSIFAKHPDSPIISFTDLRCSTSGGEIAGRVDWASPEDGPSRYGMSLVLRDADVTQLVADAAPQLQGRLTASLSIEGAWDDPLSRRGRGDVVVEGKELYKIPLLLGLMQITNLSLPVTKPFERGSVSYGVEGNKVMFESIELAAEQMRMTGTGLLDFDRKNVEMTFVTDSTLWPNVPIVGDLLRGARHELLQIHVRGSLQEPKVSAGSMPTITTTIEEVFRDDARKKK